MVHSKLVAAAILALGAIGSAQAAEVGYCNGYLAPVGWSLTTYPLAVGDMTYNNANANNCYGVVNGTDNTTEIDLLWEGGWTLATKSDEKGDTGVLINDINFAVAKQNTSVSGTWTLTGTGTPLPQYFDFVGVLKQGTGYAAYLFDNVLFDGNDGGTYAINFFKPPQTTFDVSHISIYARAGVKPDSPNPPSLVPEPTSLLLAGLAIVAAGVASRRRQFT